MNGDQPPHSEVKPSEVKASEVTPIESIIAPALKIDAIYKSIQPKARRRERLLNAGIISSALAVTYILLQIVYMLVAKWTGVSANPPLGIP